VNDSSRVLLAAVIGALAGGVAGYLYLTDDGQRMRARLEPGLDDLSRELRRLRSTVERARAAAEDGWGTLEDLSRPVRRQRVGAASSGRAPSMY
jgi:hypothetical protein